MADCGVSNGWHEEMWDLGDRSGARCGWKVLRELSPLHCSYKIPIRAFGAKISNLVPALECLQEHEGLR